MPAIQASLLILTIPSPSLYVPYLPPILPCAGPTETGVGGFVHWQLVVSASTKITSPLLEPLSDLRMRNPPDLTQAEPTAGRKTPESPEPNLNSANSQSAGTPNLTGDAILVAARAGRIESIPADIQVRCYNQLRRIGSDYVQPVPMERSAKVFWGRTGTGEKARLAWKKQGSKLT